jgi:CBS domain-containing protein
MAKTVGEIMTSQLFVCKPQDNVYEAAVIMKEHNVGVVPIVEGEKLVGLVTDRDLVIRGIAERHPGSNQITNVMTKNPVTCTPQTTVDEAVEIMAAKKIRRLPVCENGDKLVGMLAIGDISVENKFGNEAGEALSRISSPARPTDTAPMQ